MFCRIKQCQGSKNFDNSREMPKEKGPRKLQKKSEVLNEIDKFDAIKTKKILVRK